MTEKRKHQLLIRMNDDEMKLLETKFNLSTSKTKSDFVRGLISDGVVVRLDEKKISNIYRTIIGIANSDNIRYIYFPNTYCPFLFLLPYSSKAFCISLLTLSSCDLA